jgi:hypothetical protein
MPLALSKPPLTARASPPLEAGRTRGAGELALGWKGLHQAPACPSRVVLAKGAQSQGPMAMRVRHRHRLRAKWPLHRRQGRPGQTALSRPVGAGGAVLQGTPPLSLVGVPLVAHGLAQQEGLAPGGAGLTPALEAQKLTPPADALALGPHRAPPLWRRLQARFFAPRWGSEPWTGVDPPAPPLPTLLGRG